MKKLIIAVTLVLSTQLFAKEVFSDPEENFKVALKKILENYVDKNISKADLYKAATAGMVSSLNNGPKEDWNQLIPPDDFNALQNELNGKIIGIGVNLEFETKTGFGHVLGTVPGSIAEKEGIKADDQILSVDGKKFKGLKLIDLVNAVRGESGKTVSLKILREDKVISFNLARRIIPLVPVRLEQINSSTAVLAISSFNQATPKLVEQKINEINSKNYKKIILDLRGNPGGGFDPAVKVAEMFLPKEATVVMTKNRDGKMSVIKSENSLLNQDVQLTLITDEDTYSAAEFVTATLKENKKAKSVGHATYGKWNMQMIDELPNKFALKYTVKEFYSPSGKTYKGEGLKPDLEVSLPANVKLAEINDKYEVSKRLDFDSQLKAAIEISQ